MCARTLASYRWFVIPDGISNGIINLQVSVPNAQTGCPQKIKRMATNLQRFRHHEFSSCFTCSISLDSSNDHDHIVNALVDDGKLENSYDESVVARRCWTARSQLNC